MMRMRAHTWWRGRPTMEGKTARGASSPAKPLLTMPDPLSHTSALTSPSSAMAACVAAARVGGALSVPNATYNLQRLAEHPEHCSSGCATQVDGPVRHTEATCQLHNGSDSGCAAAMGLTMFCNGDGTAARADRGPSPPLGFKRWDLHSFFCCVREASSCAMRRSRGSRSTFLTCGGSNWLGLSSNS